MDVIDKRLVERMNTNERDAYLQKVPKNVSDLSDQYEEFEISHDPIHLLQKVKAKKNETGESAIEEACIAEDAE